MAHKYLIIFNFIISVCFSQTHIKDNYIKLSKFDFQEVIKGSKSITGNYYIIHSKKGKVLGIDIKRYLNGKKTGEWLGFIATVGGMDLAAVSNYVNDKLHGYFLITDNHTYKEEGYFRKGKKYGIWTKKSFFDQDIIETTKYNKKGKKHGVYTRINIEEEIKEVFFYKNGKRHGKYHFENKKYKETVLGAYKQGLKHGLWITTKEYLPEIDKDGNITPFIKKEYYKNGVLINP